MANFQAIVSAVPYPAYSNQSATRQEIAVGSVYINETTIAGGSPFVGSTFPALNRTALLVVATLAAAVASSNVYADRLVNLLAGKDQFFGAPGQGVANLDWPVPKPWRAYRYDTLSFTQNARVRLKDTMFGAAGEVLDYDLTPPVINSDRRNWKNDKGRAARQSQSDVWSRSISLYRGADTFFGGPGKSPNYDWPNPRGYRFPVDGRSITNPARTYLTDTMFGAPGQVRAYDLRMPAAAGRHVGFATGMMLTTAISGSLFRTPSLSGVGIGGPFFRDPLQ